MVSFGGVVIAVIVATMVLVTTIFTERSQGMSLYNVPLFTWSILVAGGIWLLSLPVLVANLVVMWVDARGDAFHSFGGAGLYHQISWVFDQPQVFAFAIPVLGLLGEVLPVSLQRRLKMYDLAMIAIGAFGALSFGAYAQTYFHPNANTTWLYVVGSITLLLPLLAFVASLAMTAMAAGRAPRFSAQLVLAVAGLLALFIAGALAAIRVADSLLAPVVGWLHDAIDFVFGADWNWLTRFEGWLRDNFSEIASSSLSGAMVQLALVGGLLAAAAGLFYWAPKIVGTKLPAGAGAIAALFLLGGAALSAVPDAISGFLDQPDFVARGAQRDGVEILNVISLFGSAAVFAGFGVLLVAIAAAIVFGDRDADDPDVDPRNPWSGHTLEWLTDSPPAPGNFAGPYVVTSEAPLLDDDFVNPYAEASS
jgi:heme/copper-type cytochrome/quinol oxidase subunit 1